MLRIQRNPKLLGLSSFMPNVVYSTKRGLDISMDILIPQETSADPEKRFPLVVFIQGSAWCFPNTNYEIPQMAKVADNGFVVAMVRHRSNEAGYPAPGFLEDVKCAIRFLRANAKTYHIDPERVYAFGTSSGGNTSLLLGLTGDLEIYKTDEYPEESDSVAAVIDCFGPTDMFHLFKRSPVPMAENPFILRFCGGVYDEDLVRRMSPYLLLEPGKEYVPFLIVHGDADPVVPFEESVMMAEKLEEYGADVSFVCVEGAEHEGSFWSQELLDIMIGFLKKQADPIPRKVFENPLHMPDKK